MDGYWCDVWLWEGWSPYGRVLVASDSRQEGNPCPFLSCLWPELLKPLIWFFTLWGVPMALPPNLVLQVVALLKRGAPAPMRSPQMARSQPWPLQHLPINHSRAADTLTKAKPTPQEQLFPRKKQRDALFLFKACSQKSNFTAWSVTVLELLAFLFE